MFKTKSLQLITIVYWFLLIYVIAALVWWFIALLHQNDLLMQLQGQQLSKADPDYARESGDVMSTHKRKIAQYIGEGATFLALILMGAVFVFRATRRQLRLSMQQQNFMMAITHELKTPLAVTKLNLETMQKRRLDEAQQQKLIGISLQEVNRLDTLWNNILLASQLDSGKHQILRSEVNLSELVRTVIAGFEQRNINRHLLSKIDEGCVVHGEALLLELLFSNLIENAAKYSPADSVITVELHKDNGYIHFKVKDEGTGIAAGEKSKIFEKFYRIGNEATRTAKGTGIGLYLCRQIAKDHDATIKVTDNIPKGSVFTVTFKNLS